MKERVKSLGLLSIIYLLFVSTFACAYAEEITILFTGDTHAMLYPCNCPIEPDGGVARRATLIKQLRKDNPNTLILDSGGLFAGGLMDEYTQNTQLDMERTIINLKAMELMQYDAITLGDDGFNFGRQFLEENIIKIKIPFLSCNIESDQKKPYVFLPYIIKEIAGTKIGIIGVTNLLAMQKAGGVKFIEPKLAVKRAVEELEKEDAKLIVLLSHLGEPEDLKLIEEIKGIDILIIAHSRSKEEPSSKVGSTIILRPAWQGRKLGKLSLTVMDNKIINYKVDKLRLSDKISDDPEMLSILPRCFSDNNCKKGYMVGTCQNPGANNASCIFPETAKVGLLIIVPRDCLVCQTQYNTDSLKKQFPGLTVSYLYYPGSKANKLIGDFGIKALPVYLLGKEIEKEKGFDNLKESLEVKDGFYMLKPQFSGIGYFLGREDIKGKLDLFISLYDKDIGGHLDVTKDFNPTIHFLAVEQGSGFGAAKGSLEVEECLRSVCVQKYYPEKFWDYISCRAKNINSSWWQDCLVGVDTGKIKVCAQGQEGKSLLEENISLNRQLQIMFGPTYLLDNREIFGFKKTPAKEDLKKIIKR